MKKVSVGKHKKKAGFSKQDIKLLGQHGWRQITYNWVIESEDEHVRVYIGYIGRREAFDWWIEEDIYHKKYAEWETIVRMEGTSKSLLTAIRKARLEFDHIVRFKKEQEEQAKADWEMEQWHKKHPPEPTEKELKEIEERYLGDV